LNLIVSHGERWLQGGETGTTRRLRLGGVQLRVRRAFETPEGKTAVCLNITGKVALGRKKRKKEKKVEPDELKVI